MVEEDGGGDNFGGTGGDKHGGGPKKSLINACVLHVERSDTVDIDEGLGMMSKRVGYWL
jgi:hypothetical protein